MTFSASEIEMNNAVLPEGQDDLNEVWAELFQGGNNAGKPEAGKNVKVTNKDGTSYERTVDEKGDRKEHHDGPKKGDKFFFATEKRGADSAYVFEDMNFRVSTGGWPSFVIDNLQDGTQSTFTGNRDDWTYSYHPAKHKLVAGINDGVLTFNGIPSGRPEDRNTDRAIIQHFPGNSYGGDNSRGIAGHRFTEYKLPDWASKPERDKSEKSYADLSSEYFIDGSRILHLPDQSGNHVTRYADASKDGSFSDINIRRFDDLGNRYTFKESSGFSLERKNKATYQLLPDKNGGYNIKISGPQLAKEISFHVPEGTRVASWDDGTYRFTDPSGITVFRKPDGALEITTANGTKITDLPEHTKITILPDHTVVAEKPDHTKITVSPNHTVITEKPDHTRITILPDHTVITEKPDKTKITEKPDKTRITELPDHTVITEKPDKTKITELPDHTVITEKPDKTKITEKPDHTKITEKPDGERFTEFSDLRTIKESPYYKAGKIIGYLHEEKGPKAEHNRTYDTGNKEFEQEAKSWRDFLESKGIRFSDATGETYQSDGKIYPHRSPTLQELKAITRAVWLSNPAHTAGPKGGVKFVFLNGQPLPDAAAFHLDGHIVISSRYFSDSWFYESSRPYDRGLLSSAYQIMIMHELAHNSGYLRNTDKWSNGQTEAELAKLYGYEKIIDRTATRIDQKTGNVISASKDVWAILREGNLYKKTRDGWEKCDKDGKVLGQLLSGEEMRKLAKFPTSYCDTPYEVDAEGLVCLRLGGKSRARLMKECPEVYAVVKREDDEETARFSGPNMMRSVDGGLVEKTDENLAALKKFEDDVRNGKLP